MADAPVLFCAGFGYTARALASRLIGEGWRVIGAVRDDEAAAAARKMGAEPVAWGDADGLSGVTHILISPAPDEDGDPTLRAYGDSLIAAAPDWVGYLSTTGVYGDRAGGWVDEADAPTPLTRRGELRVKAEAEWLATGLPVHVFRLAGIYGPGRGPFAKLRKGVARCILKEGQVFSRIHVEDIAATLAASIARPDPGAIYNVCDDLAAPPQDVIGYAAELLGMAPPPLTPIEDLDLPPMAASFYAESKRVSNRRIREELGVELAYPTYREGLKAVKAAEDAG